MAFNAESHAEPLGLRNNSLPSSQDANSPSREYPPQTSLGVKGFDVQGLGGSPLFWFIVIDKEGHPYAARMTRRYVDFEFPYGPLFVRGNTFSKVDIGSQLSEYRMLRGDKIDEIIRREDSISEDVLKRCTFLNPFLDKSRIVSDFCLHEDDILMPSLTDLLTSPTSLVSDLMRRAHNIALPCRFLESSELMDMLKNLPILRNIWILYSWHQDDVDSGSTRDKHKLLSLQSIERVSYLVEACDQRPSAGVQGPAELEGSYDSDKLVSILQWCAAADIRIVEVQDPCGMQADNLLLTAKFRMSRNLRPDMAAVDDSGSIDSQEGHEGLVLPQHLRNRSG
ncbi:hypothetical protein F4808DRAFT_462875 [Astrocystis sublimbata]|nr:hypothetical protein F4808DRAFT_462875 [Astrocystis sublimbata]